METLFDLLQGVGMILSMPFLMVAVVASMLVIFSPIIGFAVWWTHFTNAPFHRELRIERESLSARVNLPIEHELISEVFSKLTWKGRQTINNRDQLDAMLEKVNSRISKREEDEKFRY